MPFAIAAAAIGAGAGIYEGSQAASAQKSAADQAIKQQNLGYQRATGALQPYTEAGSTSIKALLNALGIGSGGSQGGFNLDFLRSTPGYEFEKQQGEEAITHARSAMGGVDSGATLEALDKFGTGLADTTVNDYLAKLFNLTNLGSNAAGGVASAASGVANNVGNINLQQGNIGAAQAVGQGQNIANLFNNPAVINALRSMGGGGGGGGIDPITGGPA